MRRLGVHGREAEDMQRREKVLCRIDPEGIGLEIGPSYGPLAPKRDGYRVEILDHLDRDALIRKYKDAPNVDVGRIEPVDYVWNGEPYAELIRKSKHYDWIIASHLIEHTPDLIGFLDDCDSVLKETGVLSLVIPDARYCFDHFRPLTPLSRIIDAHLHRDKIHSPGTIAEFLLNFAFRGGRLAWDEYSDDEFTFANPIERVRDAYEKSIRDPEYIDLHAWCFTPHWFRLILSDLHQLGLTPLRELAFFPTSEFEFFVTLGRCGEGPGMDRRELIEKARMELCGHRSAAPAATSRSALDFLAPRRIRAGARRLISRS
jgi:SAM-dependent methyltransferase